MEIKLTFVIGLEDKDFADDLVILSHLNKDITSERSPII